MKKALFIIIILIGIFGALLYWAFQNEITKLSQPEKNETPAPLDSFHIGNTVDKDGERVTPVCDQKEWQHIYNPHRLKIITPCVIITGFIQNEKKEVDGDWHIQLRVDPEYEFMINDKNKKLQHGALVVEPICQNAVTQKDAIESCKNYSNKITVPRIGTKVEVTGDYVLDQLHDWNELHPVYEIKEIKK